MKRKNEILCVAVAAATGSCYLIDYVGGRLGMWLPAGFLPLPAEIVPILIALGCLASIFGSLVISLVKRRPAGKTAFLLALSFLFFMLLFAIVPTKVFQAGFRQRIKVTISPAELQEIARVCHETLPIGGRLPGPEKNLWNESEDRSKWNALVSSTSLGKLDPSLVIFNGTDTVEITWGGALVGHWGVIIQTDGKTVTGDIADGIKTFIGSQ